MDHGRRSRSIGLRILLVVMAIQGMTPDLYDLTSDVLLRRLGELKAASIHLAIVAGTGMREESPPGDVPMPFGDQDEGLDDACIPALTAVGSLSRPWSKGLQRLEFPPTPWSQRPVHLHRLRLDRSHARIAPGRDVLGTLCRLTC
jgi:hypothetical protein